MSGMRGVIRLVSREYCLRVAESVITCPFPTTPAIASIKVLSVETDVLIDALQIVFFLLLLPYQNNFSHTFL
jgi:hypothetical protein